MIATCLSSWNIVTDHWEVHYWKSEIITLVTEFCL